MSDTPQGRFPLPRLTDREARVLDLLQAGSTRRDIATALFISEKTVRNHVRNIREKLHLWLVVQGDEIE